MDTTTIVILSVVTIPIIWALVAQFFGQGDEGRPVRRNPARAAAELTAAKPVELDKNCSPDFEPKFNSSEECFRREYVSYSRLRTYSSCPRKFKYAYVDGREGDGRDKRVGGGSRFHKICEQIFGQLIGKRFSKSRVFAEQIIDAEQACRFEVLLRRIDPRATIVSVEHEVAFKLAGQEFLGYIDLVLRDPDGAIHIIDYKTGKNPRAHLEQMDIYCIPYLKSRKCGKIRCSVIFVDRDEVVSWETGSDRAEEAIAGVQRMVSAVRNDKIFQTNRTPACDFCSFRRICYSHASGTSAGVKRDWVRLTSLRRGVRTRKRGSAGRSLSAGSTRESGSSDRVHVGRDQGDRPGSGGSEDVSILGTRRGQGLSKSAGQVKSDAAGGQSSDVSLEDLGFEKCRVEVDIEGGIDCIIVHNATSTFCAKDLPLGFPLFGFRDGDYWCMLSPAGWPRSILVGDHEYWFLGDDWVERIDR